MAQIIFYEKPGCGGNARQKALLTASNHQLDVRNLLTTAWSAEELRLYFGDKPVAQWFNQASPRVKSGEVDPSKLSETTALALMIEDPLLIRRPLMRVGERREAGFDQAVVDGWVGLTPSRGTVSENCPRSEAVRA
jgi:nitrogenase-associated protein